MKTKATLLTSIAISTVLLMSSMVNSPVFGINNSSNPSTSSPISSAPLAPVVPTILPGATPYNSSLDWTEYTGVAGCGGSAGVCNMNYSPQTQITASNVADLQLSYLFPLPSALSSPTAFATRVTGYTYTGGNEGTQAAVLTANGIGYALSNCLDIYGFNLATGAQLTTPTACTVPTGSSLGAVIASDVSKAPAGTTGTPCLGAPGEMDPAYDFGAYLKLPFASGGPSHQHGWNIVNSGSVGDVAWVPGWGCNIQGWQVSTGTLVANLTGMCGSAANPVPGTVSPVAGSGKTISNGIGEVQVDTHFNEIGRA